MSDEKTKLQNQSHSAISALNQSTTADDDGIQAPRDISTADKADRSMKIYVDMFARGRKRAIESGDTTPNDNDLDSLAEQAGAAAREVAQEAYDPENHPHDKIRESEYQKNLVDRKEAAKGEQHSLTKTREKESALAKLLGRFAKPLPSPYILSGATLLMALSLLPTIHDSFFSTFEDDLLAWGISLLCGLFAGLFVSWSILGAVEATGEKTALNWGGLVGGMTVAVGFAGLRLADVDGNSQLIFCLALTLLEVGIIIMLEFVAHGLRAKFGHWFEHEQKYDRANAELAAAINDNQRWQAIIAKNDTAIKSHLKYVEDKTVRYLNVAKLEANAIRSIRDGYFDGIAFNCGQVFGTYGSYDTHQKGE